MTQIRSQIDPRSEGFRRNHERMAERLAQVQALQGQVVAESASKQDKFEKKGQLLPRERVARLLDRGSSFLELSALAGWGCTMTTVRSPCSAAAPSWASARWRASAC
jgi:geranyl-CoA carboxylase beta subunit